MKIIKKILNNKKHIYLIFGTIIIYHILFFHVGVFDANDGLLKDFIKMFDFFDSAVFYVLMLLPGIISGTVSFIFTGKWKTAILSSFLAIMIWFIWFIIYAALTFKII